MSIAMIVAVGKNGEMGLDGALPWGHIPEDMRRFVRLTSGHSVLMGRKTHDSIGKLLPKRHNYVATRGHVVLPGAEIVRDLPSFLEKWRDSDEILWIIGGAELYSQAEPYAQHLEITRVAGSFSADTFFPDMHWSWWERVDRFDELSLSQHQITALTYESWNKVAGWQTALYNHSASRSAVQSTEMIKLEKARECHFCNRIQQDEAILRNSSWLVIKNNFPYQHTRLHLLVIPKKHYLSVSEMPAEMRQDYLEIIAQIEEHFALSDYSHFMRVGKMERTGASIAHLHAHVIAGDHTSPNFREVRVKLAT